MSQEFYSDTELLTAIAVGDSAAIDQLYKLYHPILIKWICSRGGEEVDAEDAFQDALLVLFEKAQDSEFCLTCRISTYLFAVCKRIWLKKITQKVPSVALDQDEEEGIQLKAEEEDVQLFLDQEAKIEQLDVALKALGEPCAGLIKAFYVEQKSMKDIADIFHYTNPENAKTQKYKCLNRLRKLFFAEALNVRNT
ncbi:MAG TPA: sigma-70 family RNA polymerase sigma factor [Edaphocola sp.]|nr:sigma-70 family RNA polymerase sigma factor [Edaphocola sp.]